MLYATVHRSEESANARKLAVDTHYSANVCAVEFHAHNQADPADNTAYILPSPRWCTTSSVAILQAVPLTEAEIEEGCYTMNLGEDAAGYTAADPTVPPNSWQF